MNKYNILICLCAYLLINCSSHPTSDTTPIHIDVDLNEKISLESLEKYLQIDSLIPISSNECAIFRFDKVIRRDSSIFILDKAQQAVFVINTSSRNINKIINFRGNARNEYIDIADIAMDKNNNIYVFDSDSRKINRYNTEGKFINSIKVNTGTSIALSRNNEIAINTNQMEDAQVFVYSSSGEQSCRIELPSQRPQYTLDDIGSIVSWGDKFIYTTPFDFNIYQIDESLSVPLVFLDFGDNQLDTEKINSLKYNEYQELLRKNTDKVMQFDHLGTYNDLIFFSTDRSDQLMYDNKEKTVTILSNVESPYYILFSAPMSVNEDGKFCVVLSNSNICNGYLPWVETNGTKLPQLSSASNFTNEGNNTFWLLMGCIK